MVQDMLTALGPVPGLAQGNQSVNEERKSPKPRIVKDMRTALWRVHTSAQLWGHQADQAEGLSVLNV